MGVGPGDRNLVFGERRRRSGGDGAGGGGELAPHAARKLRVRGRTARGYTGTRRRATKPRAPHFAATSGLRADRRLWSGVLKLTVAARSWPILVTFMS